MYIYVCTPVLVVELLVDCALGHVVAALNKWLPFVLLLTLHTVLLVLLATTTILLIIIVDHTRYKLRQYS